MSGKVIHLFDSNIKVSEFEKTLHIIYGNKPAENYELAKQRRLINDFHGAIVLLDKCTEEDETFKNAYDDKCLAYLDLNDYHNAFLNFFKSVTVDKEVFKLQKPSIYSPFFDYFITCEKQKRTKIREYLNYYSAIASKSYSCNEFADRLIKLQLFSLNDENQFYNNEYSKFLALTENTTVC